MTGAEIPDMVASRSYVITLPAAERDQLLGDISHPRPMVNSLPHAPVWFRCFPAFLQWSLAGGNELTIQSW